MSRFEYLSVLISIVIALGLTEVTVSWGRLLQNRRRVRFSWLQGFWSAYLVFFMVQFWWGFWNFRTVAGWSLASLLAVVAEAITLVLCALLMTPRQVGEGPVDLEALYFESARPFFLMAALLLVQLCLVDVAIVGLPLLHEENLVRLVGLVVVGVGAASSDRRVHRALPVAAAALMAIFLLNALML